MGLPDYIEDEVQDDLQEHGDAPIERLLDGQRRPGRDIGSANEPRTLSLIRQTGYLTDADLTAQARYDLLTRSFWKRRPPSATL